MVVVVYKKLKNNDHKKLKGGRCGEKALSIESYYGIESIIFPVLQLVSPRRFTANTTSNLISYSQSKWLKHRKSCIRVMCSSMIKIILFVFYQCCFQIVRNSRRPSISSGTTFSYSEAIITLSWNINYLHPWDNQQFSEYKPWWYHFIFSCT